MSEPRSWNRRGFDVTPNGFFNILKPSGWFPASRLPGGFRYLIGYSGKEPHRLAATPGQTGLDGSAGQQPTIALSLIEPSHDTHRLLRFLLIVLAAAAITLGMLWWISYGAPGLSSPC
jgi:hypothetical protein